jgi:hypothetical protein
MDYCQWNVSSPVHICVQHMVKSLCNVRISRLWMGLMMKWGGQSFEIMMCIPFTEHNYILYLLTPFSSMCPVYDCVLVWLLLTHLAIYRWLYSLHFLCSWCGLLHSQATCWHMFHVFHLSGSLVGSPVVGISSATNKWRLRSYRSELHRRK